MITPLPAEQVQPTFQNLLAYFEREDVHVPGPLLESIVSVKSVARAIMQGTLVICAVEQGAEQPAPELPKKDDPVKKKTARKKTTK